MLVNWSNDWIQIVDNLNDVVIDDFDYENGIRFYQGWHNENIW